MLENDQIEHMQISTCIADGCIENLFLLVQVCARGDKIRGRREGWRKESQVAKSSLSSWGSRLM